jgi:hypothetical protein
VSYCKKHKTAHALGCRECIIQALREERDEWKAKYKRLYGRQIDSIRQRLDGHE